MLRLAAQRRLLQCIREETTQSAPAKSGGSLGRKLLGLTVVSGAAVGGTIAYANTDPQFRAKVEENVPYSKEVFDATIGPKSTSAKSVQPAQKPAIVEKVAGAVQKVLPQKAEIENSAAGSGTPRPLKPREPIIPVDVKKPAIVPDAKKPSSSELESAQKEIERKLIIELESVQKKIKSANDAKLETISAIDAHTAALKKAVDDGVHANWDVVRDALKKRENLAKADLEAESVARSALDGLKKVIATGKNNSSTAGAPILLNARDSADQFAYQLDDLNRLKRGAENESHVFTEYRDLIEKSRKHFAEELKAILPNIDPNATGNKLTENELNAMIAHAHLRVDQLKRQLTEQQLREEQNIARALDEQRRTDANLSRAQLDLELRRVREIQDVETERKVRDERQNWESELEDRLRRAAAAHADNLERVVRTQKQLHDIENAQAVDEAVEKERHLHKHQVDVAVEKLRGIETALGSRVALDAENRRAKQYWLACQNLIESIIFGQKAGSSTEQRRKPLEKELAVIGSACANDEFVKTVLKHFAPETLKTGVYTEEDLKQRFKKVYTIANRTASIDENGGSPIRYLSSWVQSLFIVDLPRQFTPDESLNPATIDNREVLARTRFFVENGDFISAIRVAQLLRGEAARVAHDWISDTRAHLEARLLADLLLSHSAVTSVRSVY